MNKYQWKCKCCGKLKSIKNDRRNLGDICPSCVKKYSPMYEVVRKLPLILRETLNSEKETIKKYEELLSYANEKVPNLLLANKTMKREYTASLANLEVKLKLERETAITHENTIENLKIGNTNLREENKANKQNIFKYMEEIDKLTGEKNMWLFYLVLSWASALVVSIIVIAKMKGWI